MFSHCIILAEHLDHIRLITTDQHLFVGAARNIGIDASRADIVGFLAGDCQALPGWVSGRLREHSLGARSVSNPVVPEPGASPLQIAAVRLRHSRRNPMTKPAEVYHYGRSYTREALSLVGYFPAGLRVAEDTAYNKRLDPLAPCAWAPDVQTTHKDPASIQALVRENFVRGKRSASHAPFRAWASQGRRIFKAMHSMYVRHKNGQQILLEDPSLNPKLTHKIVRVQLLMVCVLFFGLLRALNRLAKADLAEQKARAAFTENRVGASTGSALRDIQRAVALDPQDWRKAMLLGDLLVRQGRDGADAFRSALALDPAQPEPLARLLAPHLARGDWLQSLKIAEAAAQDAPQVREHWQMAAEVAAHAGLTALATAHAQRALSLAPDLPAAHAQAEDLHRKVGNLAAALVRRATADRLQTDFDRRKGPDR